MPVRVVTSGARWPSALRAGARPEKARQRRVGGAGAGAVVCSSLLAVVHLVLSLAAVLCCKQRSDELLQDKPGCDCCTEWQARV